MRHSDGSGYALADQQTSVAVVLMVLASVGAAAVGADATPIDAAQAGQGTATGGTATTVAWTDPQITVTIDGVSTPLSHLKPGSLLGKTLRIDNAQDSTFAQVVATLATAGAVVQIAAPARH